MSIFSSSFRFPTLFIITGESNSGGVAPIAQLPTPERGVRNSVKILNNTSLASFDDLEIGVNNLIGHQGLGAYINNSFGFEVEIANRADSNLLYKMPVFLCKTGQGGSYISEWVPGASNHYAIGPFYTTFIDRINAAKGLIPYSNYNIVVLYSQGINDVILGTNLATWKASTIAHHQNIRSVLGARTPIIMTRFEGMGATGTEYSAISSVISEIADETAYTYSVSASGATLNGDKNHWDGQSTGIKLVAGRMLDVFESLI